MQKTLPSYLAEPQIQYLSQLLDDIQNGNLFIPKFQRGLVWDDKQRLDLLRSIKEGIPIGSLMVWRTTQHHLATFGKIGGQSLPPQPEPTPGVPRAYLLDGHQRLSTLFGALERVPDNSATESSDAEENWNFFYDLEDDDFILQGRRKSKHVLLPLNVLLDSLTLFKFQRALKEEALIERTDQLSTVFRNYKVAVVPLVNNDLEYAITAFKRINSSGRKLDEVDMVAALTWGETFDLREELNKIKDRLVVVGWGTLEDKFILAACKTRLSVSISDKISISNADADETSKGLKANPAIINEVAEDLVKVAEFLSNHFGIKSPELLPYSYQAIFLVEAIHQVYLFENKDVIEQLKRWFWYTSYTEEFNGIKERGLQEVLEEVLSLAHAKTSFRSGKNKINSLPKRFDFRAARAKLVLLRLAELQPHHVTKGEATGSEVAELLAVHGKNAVIRVFPSNSSPENCFIVSPKDHPAFRHRLLEQTKWSNAFLKSHAISKEAAYALKQGDYDKFLEERRKTLIEMEKAFIQPLGLDYESEEEET